MSRFFVCLCQIGQGRALARATQRCYGADVSLFGIGPMEMVVVAVVALMLFNPRELPKMLRSVAKFWGQLRATADEFKETIMTADGVDEIQEMVKGTKGHIRQVENDARRELMKARAEMRKAQQKLLKANQAKLQKQQQDFDDQKGEAGDKPSEERDQPQDKKEEAPAEAAAPTEAASEPSEPADDGPVAATPPHHRKPAPAPAPAAEADSDAGSGGDENQGAA